MAALLTSMFAAFASAQGNPTQSPATQNPATQNPATQNPATQNPATQEPQEPQQDSVDPRLQALQGRIVREIRVVTLDAQGRAAQAAEAVADRVLRGLQTRVGQPLDVARASADVATLARERRINTSCGGYVDGEQVVVVFAILSEDRIYESIKFAGLRHFTQVEMDSLLGLHADRQVTSAEAQAMRNVMLARYQRDGFQYCSIELQEADPAGETTSEWLRKNLTFRIDEGPKVTVHDVHFHGNASFPAVPPFGFLNSGDYLARGAKMQSQGAWFLASGDAYSQEIVEEDLDRLRLFYRSRGFLDATVELADARYLADHTEVDLDFVVFEGVRYKIAAVRVEAVDALDKPLPAGASIYPPGEVEQQLKLRAGEYYDHDQIRRDLRAIRDFYGERGHPPNLGTTIPEAFKILGEWPRETYGADGEVALTFQIYEGTAKTLRDVVIRGNSGTRDKVIRRNVYAWPGQRIDMTKVEKSRRLLDQLRYFQDPITLAGPRLSLQPVKDHPDQVDLGIDLKEGLTSEFRWGIGISTGTGAAAHIEFKKRNFDLWNPPSSWSPVTMFEEIFANRAFHGGGQTLDLFLSPGTQISQFGIGFVEPDLFGDYFDTYELRVNGRRRLRRFREGYTTDTVGLEVGLSRNFTETFAGGISLREDSIHVGSLAADAPLIAYDARGRTELRGLRLSLRYHDLDNPARPTDGLELSTTGEMVGGFLGGEENLTKLTANGNYYHPLYENTAGHRWVLHGEANFGVAHAFGNTDDVYLTERFYMGAFNLRGFDYRGAGPTQFGHAIGGEALFTSTVEVTFPLVATRMENQVMDRELIRGVLFSDFGLLGLSLHDPTFSEARLSVGFGIRIEVPVLEIPIALDLGWPLLYEESDDRTQLYFSISR